MGRRLASAMILLASLAPSGAYAQVNIDQGKAPSQIYDSDCAACHKSMRGLANGRGASALTSFLSEHYTSSSKQAAALAAYVLGGGGGVGTPAAVHAPKTKPEPTTAAAEEPKDRDAKRLGKPEGDPAGSKSQRPSATGQKPEVASQKPETTSQKPEVANQKPEATSQKPEAATVGQPSSAAPDRKPSGRREPNAGTAARLRAPPKPVVEPPAPPTPTAALVVPGGTGSASAGGSLGAPEPSDVQPGGDAPVPRDNIPD